MSESMSTPSTPPPSPPNPPPSDEPERQLGASASRGRSLFQNAARYVQGMARDVAAVAIGRMIGERGDDAPPNGDTADAHAAGDADTAARAEPGNARVHILHGVADRLRGAADSYIAAKLDEIEARVDIKLDHIEERIDAKIVELHRQVREMRDQELRHRLRLLKITLIFTVLVAVLSLGYKWASHYLS